MLNHFKKTWYCYNCCTMSITFHAKCCGFVMEYKKLRVKIIYYCSSWFYMVNKCDSYQVYPYQINKTKIFFGIFVIQHLVFIPILGRKFGGYIIFRVKGQRWTIFLTKQSILYLSHSDCWCRDGPFNAFILCLA